ncbi:DUF1549 domain-containing protein [Tundrisphaera lichenicola]|uniref:DUF1549 domain-containing protein n=1 Tax=Tundrisphaera lichenicola TaxID=2029860 RepID=UPI003EB7A8C2
MTRIPTIALGLACLSMIGADAPPTGERSAPSFVNDVVPVLTRLGCNSGGCHGKLAGQAGFKLSLRGYAPELDHLAITRDSKGRRIAKSRPRESLLLAKPLMRVPHQGGQKLKAGTPEYQTLLAWIAAGTPGPTGQEPTIIRLVVEPASATYRPGQSVGLRLMAHDSGGGVRDVTRLALFKSNEEGLAQVDENGRVEALRPGATSVMASFMGEVAVHVVTTPYDQEVDEAAYAARSNFIDDRAMDRLRELRLEPSPGCDDATYLRRASIDLTGSLPTPEDASAFLDDPSPDKRAALVDRLIGSPAYVDYWAMAWGELFQNRRERDNDKRGRKGVRGFAHWLREQVRTNRPWDELARDVLTARGPLNDEPAGGYYLVNRKPEELAESTSQALLGTRIACAKCHNHPLERYTQDDYYGMAAFFSRIKVDAKATDQGASVNVGAPGRRRGGRGAKADPERVGLTQPRTGEFLPPRPLDRSEITLESGQDPRAALASWMGGAGRRSFARSIVNRVWKRFFAVGLVEPVDDLRASNPASNEPLLDALVDDLIAHEYDLRRLMRLIVSSRIYALSSETLPANASDRTFFSHYLPRRLPAEVLADALAVVTGVPESYEGQPVGIRAVQLPDPQIRNDLLETFGRPDRVTACACERTADVTMPQVLHLMNGDALNRRIEDGEGRLAGLIREGQSDREIVETLFLASLARRPSESQWRTVESTLAGLEGDDRVAVFRDLMWALVNAKEFLFGH